MASRTLDPDRAADFDVGSWFGQWLHTPLPALGGQAPVSLLDVPAGRAVVSRVLEAIETGAYQ
ncbi:MAG: antitoxin Xre/MbcA/ParS toxin-binding domain-containing protein [Lautropia sp.]